MRKNVITPEESGIRIRKGRLRRAAFVKTGDPAVQMFLHRGFLFCAKPDARGGAV